MKALNLILKEARLANHLVLRDAAALSKIDQALISKFEKGKRVPTIPNLRALSHAYEIDFEQLRKAWMAEKVVEVLQYAPQDSREVWLAAESRMEYLVSTKTFEVGNPSAAIQNKLDIADELKEKWQSKKPLNPTQLRKMREYFEMDYTFESNRIEGNTLTLQETMLVVKEGITIGGKTMQEHLEAINHIEAVDFVIELVNGKEDLTPRNVYDLHRLILKEIDNNNAGCLRQVPVRISGSEHEPPQPYLLEKLMEDYFRHYTFQKESMHPVILAAEVHERLASIHPFIDGNGRTSRLVMNLVLLKNGYTIANLKGDAKSRLKYYRALENVQVSNNPEPFYELIADATIGSLEQHLALT